MTQVKTAIVTASGKGMGAACARDLHRRGYKLALLSPSGSAASLASELSGIGFTGSVTDFTALEQVVNTLLSQYGRIDVVVNNTGHPPKGDLLDISHEDWHLGFDMMLMNVIQMSKLVVPIMAKQGGGSIVNISTAAAVEPNLKFPVSSVVRAGLGAYTKLFAERYASKNIRMNNVLPGMIDSFPVNQELLSKIPMERYGTVDEVAKLVGFLASEDSAYITGQSIPIDGGMTRGL
jgi:NAD(P)-dependent dehydrogenase (short-subunit alcohol dehydrogenase family)